MANRYYVEFGAGTASNGMDGCNYLLVDCVDRDGDEVRFYAEYIEPTVDDDGIGGFLRDGYSLEDMKNLDHDGADKTIWFDTDKFDQVSYPELKADILRQAEEYNVDPETLVFNNP